MAAYNKLGSEPSSSIALTWSRLRRSRIFWLFVLVVLFFVAIIHQSDSVLQAASDNLCPTYPSQPYVPTTVYSDSTSLQQPLFPDPDPFENFVKGAECNVSRPWIHHSFLPKCTNKQQLLDAVGGGGRYGFDQPYSALGCGELLLIMPVSEHSS